MGHFKSNLRDIEFNLFEMLRRQDVLGRRALRRRGRGHRARHPRRGQPAGHRPGRGVLRRGRPAPAGLRPGHPLGQGPGGVPAVLPGLHGRRVVPPGAAGRAGRHQRPAVGHLGRRRDDPRAPTRRSGCTPTSARSPGRCGSSAPRSSGASPSSAVAGRWGYTMVLTEPDAGSDVGAGRTRAVQQPTAPGTSRASSASSPAPSTTCPTTSCTWSWPVPRGPAPAPRACRCSWCPSTTSGRTASWASATAST